MTKTVVICCIYGIILPSYMGVIISHYKDPYKPISTMECQPRVLLPLLMWPFLQFQAAWQPSPLYGATSARGQAEELHYGQDFDPTWAAPCGQAAESETQAAIIDLDGKFYTDPPYIQANGAGSRVKFGVDG